MPLSEQEKQELSDWLVNEIVSETPIGLSVINMTMPKGSPARAEFDGLGDLMSGKVMPDYMVTGDGYNA